MCVFCDIVEGKLEAHKVYEDDDFLAFLDRSLLTYGHTLFITKKHVEDLWDLDAEEIGRLFATSKKVVDAMEKSLEPRRVMLAVLGDDIPHVHVHLVPRYPDDGHGGAIKFSKRFSLPEEKMEKLAGKVRSAL